MATYRTVVEPGYTEAHPAVRRATGPPPEGYRTFEVRTSADSRNRAWREVSWTIQARHADDAEHAAKVLHAPKVGSLGVYAESCREVAGHGR